jgi:hypothetical protein
MISVFQQAQNFGEQKIKAINQLFLAIISCNNAKISHKRS